MADAAQAYRAALIAHSVASEKLAAASSLETLTGTAVDKGVTPAGLQAARDADVLSVSVVAPEEITGAATLSAAQQWLRKGTGNTIELRELVALHATPSTSFTITVPDALATSFPGAYWVVFKPVEQTGVVSIARQTNGTINGGTAAIAMAGGRSKISIWIESNPGTAPKIIVKGETTESSTLYGALIGSDQVASALELKDIAETVVAKGTLATGAISYDYSAGGYQWGTTGGGNITSVAITNPPATGKSGTLTLEFVQGATPRTIAWGASFRFPGGTDYQLTQSTGAVDIFVLTTRDGGSTWYVAEAGKAFAA